MLNSGSLSDHARDASERIENLCKEIVTYFKSNEAKCASTISNALVPTSLSACCP